MCRYTGHNWMKHRILLAVYLPMVLTTQSCLTSHLVTVFAASPLGELLRTVLVVTTGSLLLNVALQTKATDGAVCHFTLLF